MKAAASFNLLDQVNVQHLLQISDLVGTRNWLWKILFMALDLRDTTFEQVIELLEFFGPLAS